MKTVGDVLRTAREVKGFSLDYISESLKIRVKYLEALESGDYSIFPSAVYIKGFLKNYSKFLDIPEEEILAFYRREYTTKNSGKDEIDYDQRPVIRSIKFALKPAHVVAITTLLIVGFILIYLFYEFRQFSAPPQLSVSSPTNNQVVNSQTLLVQGNTNNSGNKVTINGQLIPNVSTNGSFSFTVNLHPQENDLIISVANSLNVTTTIRRTVIYTDNSLNVSITPISPSQTSSQVMNGRVEITNSPTYIKLVIDGKSYFEGVLSTGSIKSFSAKSSIYIDTGREGDTNFSINGQNISFSSGHQNAGGVELTAILNPDGTISFQ